MGYSMVTRRKSVSLSSLGIHVPVHRSSPSHHHSNAANHSKSTSASSSATASASMSSTSPSSPTATASSAAMPPSKKMKRSHSDEAHPDTPASPSKRHQTVKFETTPPPSPKGDQASVVDMDMSDAAATRKIDLSAVNDEIVEAVIVRLQEEANRPHLVKELTAVLMQQLRIVQQSANPSAIISSRLATFMKRPCWGATAPCPLAKQLETVHPRRTYFYLTTCPHQPIPDPATSAFVSRTSIITPPLSSNASGSVATDEDARRRELSPSPEVDLGYDFDDMDDDVPMPSTPIGSFSDRIPKLDASLPRGQRANSPPLEKDEKEFTQTANHLQKRKLSGDMLSSAPIESSSMELDEAHRDSDPPLFGVKTSTLIVGTSPHAPLVASPAIRPSLNLNLKRDTEAESWAKLDAMLDWDRSPENVELDELDGLLDDF